MRKNWNDKNYMKIEKKKKQNQDKKKSKRIMKKIKKEN